jgi:hypothetical protein
MTTTRIETYTLAHRADLYITDCPTCGVVHGIPNAMKDRRYKDGGSFYCPNGHTSSWRETEEDRQRKKATRLQAELDQALAASQSNAWAAETARKALVRDRHRFANGVCPCCNRSFTALTRHMATQHPDYDPTTLAIGTDETRYACSCGRYFDTPHGLSIHQGRNRRPGWETSKSRWAQHLTLVER